MLLGRQSRLLQFKRRLWGGLRIPLLHPTLFDDPSLGHVKFGAIVFTVSGWELLTHKKPL